MDYSHKYGMGYLLSNGSTGVFFNDTSKIILDPKGEYFLYLERKKGERQDAILFKGSLKDYANNKDVKQKLYKKVTILQHIRSYLENSTKRMT